ncbi:MSHA pilin protein MshA [Inhella inkyongensis]|uniref:MSHA pilin protein MshA n=1 Tax=Inhella inkyongensis TaxID=392593 RepID=A0A840S1T2_9BURK|nr:prepilin-type N-terminal cleavage/methylation domain-containing protein [Inhella inkyongensis]MBB5204255.1 MSHA pilin protein MshA [Inhella inkyongensis]
MPSRQRGFTIIELIVVIVVLGILAAIALPKFVHLSGEARIGKMNGAAGAINSAAATIHAKWLANGSPTAGTLAYEGGSLTVATQIVNGYPAASVIATLAGLSSNDFNAGTVAAGAIPISDISKAACLITYTEAAAGAAPTISTTALTLANCQ